VAIIACTKKLFQQSGFPESPVLEVGYQPLQSWHAHLFKIGRKNCIMLMNDMSRYQMVLYGVKKEHFNDFATVLRTNLDIVMKADKFTPPEIESVTSSKKPIIFTKTHNRSILGSINDQIFMTETWIQGYLPTEQLNIVPLNVELNDSVMLKLKEFNPRLAMKKALESR
jgi:hypothetical protein